MDANDRYGADKFKISKTANAALRSARRQCEYQAGYGLSSAAHCGELR